MKCRYYAGFALFALIALTVAFAGAGQASTHDGAAIAQYPVVYGSGNTTSNNTGNESASPMSTNGTNPAPDAIWDDILGQIKNLPGSIWNWIIDGFNIAMQGLITTIFGIFIILFKSPPLVGNGPLEALWSTVVLIMDGLLGIVFVGIGIAYLWSGLQPQMRAEIKLMLPNLIILMILGHSSIYICQFVLDLNDAMVEAILGDGFSKYCPMIPPTAGIALLLLLGIVMILVIIVGIILAMRVVIILFTTVLMPVACLCWVFPQTRGFSKTIISMFATWTFLTFFESIALVVAFIALVSMNQWVAWLIFIAALCFMISLPKMLTKGMASAGGGGGNSLLGITAIAGTAAMAVTGVGAGVAGAAGAMKGGMATASAAGKGIGSSVANGFAKAPMGFANGFSSAAQKFATAAPKSGLKKLTNPMQAFRMEYGKVNNGGESKSGPKENSDVGRIRNKYGLRNESAVKARTAKGVPS